MTLIYLLKLQVLFDRAPNYRDSIRAGEDARYLWFALRDWRGDDPEDYFGALGALAEKKLKAFKLQSEVDNVIEIVRRLDISGMSKVTRSQSPPCPRHFPFPYSYSVLFAVFFQMEKPALIP